MWFAIFFSKRHFPLILITCSMFILILSCFLSRSCSFSQTARTDQADQLRAALITALETRILDPKKIHPTTICATMCDPKFHKLKWCKLDRGLKEHFKSVFLDELFKMHSARRALSVSAPLSPAAHESDHSDVESSSSSSSSSSNSGGGGNGVAARALPIGNLLGNSRIGALGSALDRFMESDSDSDSDSDSEASSAPGEDLRRAISLQVERFIQDVPKMPLEENGRFLDSLDFWRQNVKALHDPFDLITPMARRVLSVPASEAPSERVFSRLSLLIRSLRNRLNSDLVSDTMFLSCNRKYFASLPGGLHLRPDHVNFISVTCISFCRVICF